MKYNRKDIMTQAHTFYRDGRFGDWAECLRKAWFNAKVTKRTLEALGQEARTWYGWTQVGKEVRHGEKTVAQVVIFAPLKTKTTTTKSYFTAEQVVDLGAQPIEIK